MRTSIKVIVGIAVLVIMAGSAAASELTSGYLNSATREAMVSFSNNGVSLYLYNAPIPLQFGEGRYQPEGKLWVVTYSGRASVARGRFTDRLGHTIMAPRDGYDKVVYLNRYGNIFAAAGLEEAELASFMPSDQAHTVDLVVNAQKYPIFGAMRYSAHVLSEMRASDEEVAETFVMSMGWMGGSDVSALIQKVVTMARDRQGSPIDALRKRFDVRSNTDVAASVSAGISLVAQGGNGTGGGNPVAQGGNGTGGGNPVAQGGNGTGGGNPVAQGGNGTGGGNPVAQGGNGTGGGNPVAQGGNGTGGGNPVAQGGNGTGGGNPVAQGGNGTGGGNPVSAYDQMLKWSSSAPECDVEISGGGDSAVMSLPKARSLNAFTRGTVLMLQ